MLTGQKIKDKEFARTAMRQKKPGSRKGKSARPRIRRSISEIYDALGAIYFRRAYRMSFESFWELHEQLKDGIAEAVKTKRTLRTLLSS